METEQKFTLSDFTKEEAEALTKDLTEILSKHSAHLEPIPKFVRGGMSFSIACEIVALKKTPIEAPIKSPYAGNGTDPAETTQTD